MGGGDSIWNRKFRCVRDAWTSIPVRVAACEAPVRADARSGPSRGEAAARCGPIRNRKFSIQDSKLDGLPGLARACSRFGTQPAACRCLTALIPARAKPAAERTGLRRRGAALRPGAAAGCCGFLRSRKFSIQNSRFKIINRDAACRGSSDAEELRASAAGGCGPPIAARLILTTYFPAKPAAERTSLRRSSDAIQNPEFKIQNYEIQAAACGEPLEADLRVASLRCRETAARSAFTRPKFRIIKSECSLGLLGPGGPIQTRNTLPAELRTFAVPCGTANEF